MQIGYACGVLGHWPETEIHDQAGRPLPISRGQVIRALV